MEKATQYCYLISQTLLILKEQSMTGVLLQLLQYMQPYGLIKA